MGKEKHYVDNDKFYAAMIDYKAAVEKAKKEGKPRPHVTNYIGDCLMKIAVHLSYKPNFINYRFRDDMISDGITNCLQYIDNFNPDKSSNPFSYFTQITYYAFLRRIAKEKKHLYTKYKYMKANPIIDDDYPELQIKHTDYSEEYIDQFIEDFESTKRREVKKKKVKEEE